MANIRTKDLNLLAVFIGIAEEPNLSRASQRLGLSQPALSHALARLREQFGDPLFVRSQRGLVATPRVALLLPQVRTLLSLAETLYGTDEGLDLARLERKVVIASTAYFEARMITGFLTEVGKQAPGLKIETRTLVGGFPKQELESGEIDLAIAAYFEDLPGNYRIKTIFSDRFVCVCSASNPYLKTKRSQADYLACGHLHIDVPAGVVAHVDHFLEAKSKRRNIALKIGNFLTPLQVVSQTDLLLTCPGSLAESYREMTDLAITELPFKLPRIETKMVWHEKNQRDPFHVWLRERLGHP